MMRRVLSITWGACKGVIKYPALSRRMERFRGQAAQDKPTIGGTLGQPAHEVGAPVGAEGNVNLQRVAARMDFLLQIAANPINHLEFVLLAGELQAGNFLMIY